MLRRDYAATVIVFMWPMAHFPTFNVHSFRKGLSRLFFGATISFAKTNSSATVAVLDRCFHKIERASDHALFGRATAPPHLRHNNKASSFVV
jgi:hypothetical protein